MSMWSWVPIYRKNTSLTASPSFKIRYFLNLTLITTLSQERNSRKNSEWIQWTFRTRRKTPPGNSSEWIKSPLWLKNVFRFVMKREPWLQLPSSHSLNWPANMYARIGATGTSTSFSQWLTRVTTREIWDGWDSQPNRVSAK